MSKASKAVLLAVMVCSVPVEAQTLGGNNAWTGNETHAGAETFGNLDKMCVVDGTLNTTIAAAITACGSNSVVRIPKGTYSLSAALAPAAGQRLLCDDGATITQNNTANLTALINFATNSANGASIQNCIVDGNLANETVDLTSGHYLIQIGSASDVTVVGNLVQNAPSVGLGLSTGLRPRVRDNTFQNITTMSVAFYTGVASTPTAGAIVGNRLLGNLGYFPIGLQFSDGNLIQQNSILGIQLVQQVDTTGTGVAPHSGSPNFATLAVGMIMRIAGSEYLIAAKSSNTALTLSSSAGTQTNASAVSGTADLINVDSSGSNNIVSNILSQGMSGGVVIHQFALGAESSTGNNVVGNVINQTGGACIGVSSLSGTATVDGTNISSNVAANCAMGHAANLPISYGNGAIVLNGPETNNTLIGDNVVRDFNGNTSYGIYINSDVPAGGAKLGSNLLVGAANSGISGGSWSTYTPTLTAGSGSFTSASATGRYYEVGKMVAFQISVNITTNGTAAGGIVATLPFPNNSTATYTASGRADGVSGKALQARATAGSGTISIWNYDTTYPGSNGEICVISGVYERQ